MKSKTVDHQPVSSTSHQAASELMEAMPAIMQFVRAEMRSQREPSLSVPQFRVLAFLGRHPHASLSKVADHIGITRATASTMVDRLVQRELVDRQEDPHERRHIMLKLTQMGSDRLEEMRNTTRQKIADLLDELTPKELDHVAIGLTLLGRVFNTANPDGDESVIK
jgi:DNA-binding MarR family transcriptional regulator